VFFSAKLEAAKAEAEAVSGLVLANVGTWLM
jgi:hypothetical protein